MNRYNGRPVQALQSRPGSFRSRVQHFFYTRKRLFLFAGMGMLAAAFLTIAVQLAYPRDRLWLGAHLQGQAVGGQTISEASKTVERVYKDAKVELRLDNKIEKAAYREIGIDPASNVAAKQAAQYSLWQRLVPFALFFSRNHAVEATFDDERLNYYAEQMAQKHTVPAVNASVKVEGSEVKLVSAQPSKEYHAQDIARAIRKEPIQKKAQVSVAAITSDPVRDNDSVREAIAKAQRVIDTPMSLTLDSKETTVSKETVAGWLDFPEDPATKKLTLAVKTDPIKSYVSGLQSKVYKAPGTTKVTLVDGQETARTSGADGRGLDIDGAVSQISQAITQTKPLKLSLSVVAIPAKVTYDKQYSDTQAGLAAFMRDLGTSGMGISIIELGGRGRTANANGSKAFTAASTYKLYVAYAVVKQIESGAMSWGEQITGGRDAASCFDAMIVVSDNPCGKAFGDKIGWGKIQDMVRGQGMTSTTLNGSLSTTANDLALFLRKLQDGSLMSGDGTGRLLDAMRRQIYRSGVPAGTKVTVANKVGFLGSLLHDAAIVYGPKGPYVLVFMTSGSSWGAIANTSSQIHSYLNR